MSYFEPLTSSHRINTHGRLVRCPHCYHAKRIYHLSFSSLGCMNCKAKVSKYDWFIGPAVTRKDLRPKSRYKAEHTKRRRRLYAKTKKELLTRLMDAKFEYKISKEIRPGWSCPDLVLVIDRRFDRAVKAFSDKVLSDNQSLEWADSSGSRSVHLFMVNGEQEDLPFRTFQLFKDFLLERYTNVDLLMHREDPGLGIFLPELDEAMLQAGRTPNGCIKAGIE